MRPLTGRRIIGRSLHREPSDRRGGGKVNDPIALVPNIYVDSNAAGGGDGLTAGTAFQTIAAAQSAVVTGQVIGLARGSYWREQFTFPANNINIVSYGTGAMPVIDGADLSGTWTAHADTINYPNVWQQSWSRTSATTTSSEHLGLWADGVRPRYAASLADLQTNGGWFASSLTTQSSTVYVKSATDPNSSGVVYEITKRHYGFSAHETTVGATRSNCNVVGPIEVKRCVGHYNALPGGALSQNKRLLLRDGNIHHSVTQGALTEDVVAIEYTPTLAPSIFVAFTADPTTFDHTFRRTHALMPGGSDRIPDGNASAFYGHGSSPTSMRDMIIEQCIARGIPIGGPAALSMILKDSYCEDPYGVAIGAVQTTALVERTWVHETAAPSGTVSNRGAIRRISAGAAVTIRSSAVLSRAGAGVLMGTSDPVTIVRSSFYSANSSNPFTGVTASLTTPNITYSVFVGGRSYGLLATGYTGDFNVFYFIGQVFAQFQIDGNVHNSLSAWQAATGQDTNSVFLKNTDQVSGNGIAFWLGLSSGANAGPTDGDWRINPNAKVYNGAGTGLTGVFADGVTPLTAAGPQERWDFNTRAVVSGPPTRLPILPVTVAEMRTYLESPATWAF